MFNRTQGGGGHIPHGFPGNMNDPRQALPVRPAGPPAQGSGGLPSARGTRPAGPHPLQRQARGTQPAGPSQPAAAAEPAAPVVGARTTVLDTVDWNSKANLEDIGHLIVLGHDQRRGDPRLGHAQVGGRPDTRLDLYTDSTMPVQDFHRGEAKGRQAALTVLENTEHAFRLQGTPAGREIERARTWLANPDNRLTAGAFGGMMKAVSEAVHAQEMQRAGPSRAPRQTGRMPMDCMTHLGYEIRHAQRNAGPGQQEFLRKLGFETMDRVMQHRLSFGSTKAWLDKVADDCEDRGLGGLARLAGQLSDDIPAPSQLRDHATQLHDNVYGRALESVMINELVHNTPDSVKDSMEALSGHLDHALSRLAPGDQQRTAVAVQDMMRHERRGWQANAPELEAFFQAPPGHELRALKNLLRAPKETGFDCIAVPYLTVKMSLCMGDGAPWMRRANVNYRDVVGPASARETEMQPNPNRATAKAGITSHHQPDTVRTHPAEAAMHPGDRNRPKLHDTSPELRSALQHGEPFVSGVSGSTNIVMHAVGHMLAKGGDIDAKDALLGTMMFLTHDGGHSMHEAMWVGNQLDGKLGLGMGMPGGDPAKYVSDYDSFIESFGPENGRDTLRAAADKAWQVTLNQFGRTSHFSADNPAP
ncbi:hypothetical protein ACFFTM_08685 [Pseudoduganella plicata]|uniref:Uncharacterized protein n=1 Tax=Pseudoduganella plicata TaxID=321984 RepID=A0A4P7BA54_9BURK|nr:hypothetical protein [Pseudoduganella plicata]QBQ35441.1 hypothetical protein E1742_04125 [Pseudoduganella plicata]GGZ01798.1 hypothetical protein GCM10007388_39420 [Pseudoduganella plicata]